MKDKTINCQDCKSEFAFTKGEQEFYISKGLKDPVRCLVCRATERAAEKDQFRGVNKRIFQKGQK